MARNYFSLDIGESFIKIADVERTGDVFKIVNLGIFPTNKLFFNSNLEKVNIEQAAKLAEYIRKLKITKTKVNLIIPDSSSYNQIVEMPRLNEKELLSAIKYQADQFIPMPIDDVSLDIEILLEKKTEKKILTFISAASKKVVEKMQMTLEYVGLEIDSIETESSATGRFLSEIYKNTNLGPDNKNSGFLFINIGYTTTSLYFFDLTLKLITQIHNFFIGYHIFLEEIQVNLNKDETSVIELLRTFNTDDPKSEELKPILSAAIKDFLFQIQRFQNLLYEQHKVNISTMYLFNEIFRFPGFRKVIEDKFKISTQLVNLTSIVKGENIPPYLEKDIGYFLPSLGGNFR